MINRRQLPIASPCQQFVGQPATDDVPAYCTRCEKHVHDLSKMNEQQVVGLLARHYGERLCVSYRVRTDGEIALRPTPSRLAPAALALSLAGCAGHLADTDIMHDDCVDPAGYEMPCPSPRPDVAVIPDAIDPPAVVPTTLEPKTLTPPVVHDFGDTVEVAGGMVPMTEPEPIELLDGDVFVGERGDLPGPGHLDPALMRRVARERDRLDREERRRVGRNKKRTASR